MNKRTLIVIFCLSAMVLFAGLLVGALTSCATQVGTPVNGLLTGTVTLEGVTDNSGAIVGVSGTSLTGTTSRDGTFQVWNVPTGTVTVNCYKNGYDLGSRPDLVVKRGVVTDGVDFYLVTTNPPPLPVQW
jgi:hypothetical protein